MSAEWMGSSACLEIEPELFFPEGKSQESWVDEAKAVCRSCLVRTPCLERALRNNEEHGIFAGTTPDDRRRIVRNRTRTSPEEVAS